MYWTGRLSGVWLCFSCLVDARLQAAPDMGLEMDRSDAALSVVYRISRGGGVGPADGSNGRHEPIPHDRIAPQVALAHAQNRPPVYSDFLLPPSADEDPSQGRHHPPCLQQGLWCVFKVLAATLGWSSLRAERYSRNSIQSRWMEVVCGCFDSYRTVARKSDRFQQDKDER